MSRSRGARTGSSPRTSARSRTLDTTFGSDGLMSVDFRGFGDEAEDVALDSAGRIVAAGYTLAPGGDQFALLRVLP